LGRPLPPLGARPSPRLQMSTDARSAPTMAVPHITYLSAEERVAIHEQTLNVLEQVGVGYNHTSAVTLLEDAGAVVDRQALTARLPRELVERCLATTPRQILLAARDPANDVIVGDGSITFTTDGTATYIVDDRTGERREGSADDLRTVMRLFDALPNIDYVWPTLSARDLDPVTANLEIEAISFASCAKHIQDEVRSPEYVAPLLEMFAAVAGAPVAERPVFSAINCTIAPLQHDAAMTEASMALARAGVPIVVMPMPLMGTTAPMSVAATTVVTLAELLSAVVLFQLAAPGCPLLAAPEPGVANLRNGLYLCGTPEAALATLACTDMCKHYGLPVQGTGFGGDGKAADYQEGAEGAASCLQSALSGVDTLVGVGTMDGAQATSLAKIVLDDDVAGMVRRYLAETPFSWADSLLEDIREVGPGGHFLGRRSTRERRDDVWQPASFRRGGFLAYQGRTLVDDALERARDLLVTHEVLPIAEDVQRHIDGVIADFRKVTA
jgi:trimethylamine---corrinoid protein Co-methyltransferase